MPELTNAELVAKWAPPEETPSAPVVETPETDEVEVPETLAEATPAAEKAETKAKKEEPKKEEKKRPGRPKKEVEAAEVTEAEEVETPVIADEDQTLIDLYSADDTAEIPEVTGTDEVSAQIKQEYEHLKEVVADPFISSYIEWKKAGGSNPKDFVKELGITSQERSIEDYIRMEAESFGLEGEELESAVQEEIERYGELTSMQKKKKLQEYRNADKGKLDEKLKSFSETQSAKAKQVEAAQKTATELLQDKVSKLKGTKYKGLFIDEPMAKQIQKMAPHLTPSVFDEKGALSYDVERGVRLAILDAYEGKLLKETFNLGRTAAAKEFALKRHRPNADTHASPVTSAPSSDEEFENARKSLSKKMGGLGN